MSTISAAAVKNLRDRTNIPMMECKAALTEADGDMEKAIEILRKKNKDVQDKHGERETAEGRIGVFIDPAKKVGAIVEMRCESAPVAKSEQFVQLGQRPRQAGRPEGPGDGRGAAGAAVRRRPKQDGQRAHRRGGRPDPREHEAGPLDAPDRACSAATSITTARVGVMVQVEGDKADPQLLRDVCMHIAAKNPVAARREDVPARPDREGEGDRHGPGGRPEQAASRPTSSRRSPRAR